jgi:hypothetical protein
MRTRLFSGVLCAVLVSGATDACAAARTYLTYSQLTSGLPAFTTTVPMDVAFVPNPSDNQAPTDSFSGTLYITSSTVSTPWTSCNTTIVPGGCSGAYSFPSSAWWGYDFVQNGQDIIPVRRDAVSVSSSGWWDVVLQPGRVWKETADQGYTRVAVPFALMEKNANCTQNGVMMFLFKAGGAPNVSRVAVEITKETCLYNRFDMVGLLTATFSPHTIANASTLIANYASEIANRMPTRPVAQLTTDFPALGLNPANLKIGDPTHVTAYGLVVKLNGTYTNYVGDCQTRNGLYPYCDVMVLPSYSTAKSAYAALALMHLQTLNSASKTQLISTWVTAPNCKPPGTAVWSDVAFGNVLDMASGNYTSSAFESDENNLMNGLFSATSNSAKVSFAWCTFPNKTTPGTTWIYHTSDTYLLGRAMQVFLTYQAGYNGSSDLLMNFVAADIYAPLGLSPTSQWSRRTFGFGDPMQTFTGWGMTWVRGDIARIAKFVSIDHGAIFGSQKLDATMLDEALQRVGSYPGGLNTHDPKGILWYQHGIWAKNVQTPVGCANPTYVPHMSGYGGITVAMFPPVNASGVIYYNFTDEGDAAFDWSNPAIEAGKFGNYCH